MDQDPPPYEAGTSSHHEQKSALPQKPAYPPSSAPAHAVYVANPGQPTYSVQPGYPAQNVPIMTSTVTRTVVQQQPPAVLLTPGLAYREVPVSLQCHVCKTQIVTSTEHHPGTMSWLACCAMASFGCFLGCCLIPFCVRELQDVTHTCPNCKTVLGIYNRW